ncbi:hypothetical protein HanRHA438_Chr07g0314741 [Helianthus annuus]|nr:hypothetical protein HanHA89_Chr07g0268471 [Helianthus annuus]KAJ0731997.1 hypothetical protein HanOQP8_Chr07g0258221 [Helianthus annuus]KAJ0908825.1 hypothetical protein HanRHA438_Chr07g0314741 [Helianthus annuus]
MSAVCGPHLQASAGEEVEQRSAVCKEKSVCFFIYTKTSFHNTHNTPPSLSLFIYHFHLFPQILTTQNHYNLPTEKGFCLRFTTMEDYYMESNLCSGTDVKVDTGLPVLEPSSDNMNIGDNRDEVDATLALNGPISLPTEMEFRNLLLTGLWLLQILLQFRKLPTMTVQISQCNLMKK